MSFPNLPHQQQPLGSHLPPPKITSSKTRSRSTAVSRTYRAGRVTKGIPKAASPPVLHAPSQAVWRQGGMQKSQPFVAAPRAVHHSHGAGIQDGWATGWMGSCPTKSSPSPKARGLLISILIPAQAVSNKAGPFIQAYHCFPDSQCFIIN